MRRPGLVLLLLMLLTLCCALPVCAGDPDASAGTVQYSADFGDYTALRDTGIRFGTLSRPDAAMTLGDGELTVVASDGQKTYLLLPEPTDWTDTYTVECTFRFVDVISSNGYCGIILSSQGDAPSNRTELIFRANGTVEGYTAEANEALKSAAAAGTPVTVRILVNYGFLVEFRLEINGESVGVYTPQTLSRLAEGGRGFVTRNATVAFNSVRVVEGDYEDLADAPEAASYVAPPEWQMPVQPSPATGEGTFLTALCAMGGSAAAALYLVRRRKKGII